MISQKTRSTLKITVGTIIITVGTLLLVMFASGYSFDILQGRVLTTGLALLNSNPGGSSININGKTISQKTPYRLEGIETGDLNVRYTHPGYRDWNSSFFVQAGEVTFADYALLIPANIEPQGVSTPTTFTNIFHSDQHSKLALVADSPVSLWELGSNGQVNRIFTPTALNGHQPTKIGQVKFSQEANQVLLNVTYDDSTTNQFLVSYPGGQVTNLNDMFHIALGQLEFNPQNSHELYSLKDGLIHRLNIDTQNNTTLALSNISSFSLDHDRLFTLENNPTPSVTQLLVSYDLAGNGRYVLQEFPKLAVPGVLKPSQLHGITYVAVLDPSSKSVTMIRREADKVDSSGLGSNITAQSFSPSSRFYTYIQNDIIRTLDLEFTDHYQSQTIGSEIGDLQWLSEFQVMFKAADGQHIIDFNGFNNYVLPPSSTSNQFEYGVNIDDKKITYLLHGQLFSYSLQPKGGLINFR